MDTPTSLVVIDTVQVDHGVDYKIFVNECDLVDPRSTINPKEYRAIRRPSCRDNNRKTEIIPGHLWCHLVSSMLQGYRFFSQQPQMLRPDNGSFMIMVCDTDVDDCYPMSWRCPPTGDGRFPDCRWNLKREIFWVFVVR